MSRYSVAEVSSRF